MKKNWDLLLNFWQYRKSKFFLRIENLDDFIIGGGDAPFR